MRREIRLGDLNRALSLTEEGWARWRTRPQSQQHWELRLLRAQILALQGRAREVLELLADQPPASPAFQLHRIRRLMCLGRARFLQAEYPESRRILDEALALARAWGDASLQAEIQLWRGSTLARSGEFEAADAAYCEALELAERAGDDYLQAAALGNR
ncbi:MAG: tetratricopeptide repeat protein, partial [Bryobacteraceae bacterium]